MTLGEVSNLSLAQFEGLLECHQRKQARKLRDLAVGTRAASAEDKAFGKFIRSLE